MSDERSIEFPPGALDALNQWLGERVATLVHAWLTDDDKTVLAVVATVGEEAFDSETDGYDVDSIELNMLTVYDSVQEGWKVEADGQQHLGLLFGELANRFVDEFKGVDEAPGQ